MLPDKPGQAMGVNILNARFIIKLYLVFLLDEESVINNIVPNYQYITEFP